jgi:hypothetical protein
VVESPRAVLPRTGLVGVLGRSTLWDVRETARSAAFAGVSMVLAWLVTAATDEGGVAWAERAARVLPLAPACAAWGTWLGQARGWAKGEGRALAGLGRSPLAVSAASVLGGAVVAWAAALTIALVTRVDVATFYPVARAPDAFVAEGGGTFLEVATGQRVRSDGSIAPPSGAASHLPTSSPIPAGGRAAAALATGLAGLSLPLLVARTSRGSRLERAAVILLSSAASVFLFHAVAAHLVGAMAAILPSLCLLVWACLRLSDGTRARF